MVCHRRAGKTVAAVNELIIRALYTQKPNARYGYVAPFREQAKDIAWEYLKQFGRDFAEPKGVRESELRLKLVNGAWITLYGSDNPDALRGRYLDGVVLDEYGDCRPGVWGEVIRPTLADRHGWGVFIGTYKGKNHFYHVAEKAKNNTRWYRMILKASQSGIIRPEELEDLRLELSDEEYQQEMECDPNAAIKGTYYAAQIAELEKNGQIKEQDLYNDKEPVHVAADLGYKDSTAIWFWQDTQEGPVVIDYHEAAGKKPDYYFGMFDQKPYKYDEIWLPHDAKADTLSTQRTTLEQFQDHFRNQKVHIRKTPKLTKQQGIDALRLALKFMRFDTRKTGDGVEALRAYSRKYDSFNKIFLAAPKHDWACLPGGELINTPTGPKPVENFRSGDEVITAGKIGRVINAGRVKTSAVLNLKLSNGSTIRCTPEHKIFTQLGLVMAKDLDYNHQLLQQHEVMTWLASENGIRKAFTESFKASGTTIGPSENFTLARKGVSRLSYIACSGSTITARCQRLVQSFQSTMTGMISTLITGLDARTPIMASHLSLRTPALSLTGSDITSTPINRTITTPKTTEKRQSCIGIFTQSSTGRYLTALIYTISTTIQAITTALTYKPLTLRSIARCTEVDVFDIEVESDHAYTLTRSNVVVSNSDGADGARYMALVCRLPKGELGRQVLDARTKTGVNGDTIEKPAIIQPFQPERMTLNGLFEENERNTKRSFEKLRM